MLSKNNYQEKLRNIIAKRNHFSIRKLNIGTVSVLIGLSFMGLANDQKAEAAEPESAKEAVTENLEQPLDIDQSKNINPDAIENGTANAGETDAKNGVQPSMVSASQNKINNSKNQNIDIPKEKNAEEKSAKHIDKPENKNALTQNILQVAGKKTPLNERAVNQSLARSVIPHGNISQWDYTLDYNGTPGTVRLNSYNGTIDSNTDIVIPNAADFNDQLTGSHSLVKQVDLWREQAEQLSKARSITISKNGNDKTVNAVDGLGGWNSWNSAFANSDSLQTVDLSNLRIADLNDFSSLFANDKNLKSVKGLNTWDTSKINNLTKMFEKCTSLKDLDLSNWKFDNLYIEQASDRGQSSGRPNGLGNLVTGDKLTNLNLSNWDFSRNNQLTQINGWKCYINGIAGEYQGIFNNAKIDSINASGWKWPENTSTKINLEGLFSGTDLKNIDISNWSGGNTAITGLKHLFNANSNLTTITGIENLMANDNQVEDISMMFEGDTSLTSLDLSRWKTNHVKYMTSVFNMGPDHKSQMTKLDISNWNLSSLINGMHGDFVTQLGDGGSGLTIKASNWDFGNNTTNANNIFSNLKKLRSIDVSGWKSPKVSQFISTFANDPQLATISGLGDIDTNSADNLSAMFDNDPALTSLDGIQNWNTANVTDMSKMFAIESNISYLTSANNAAVTPALTSIPDLSSWDFRKVTTTDWMFGGQTNLTGDIILTNKEAPRLTSAEGMFYNAGNNNTINLSGWQTPTLVQIFAMFENSGAKNIKLDGWDFSHGKRNSSIDNFGSTFANLRNPAIISLEGIELPADASVTINPTPNLVGGDTVVDSFSILSFKGDKPIVVLSDQKPIQDLNKSTWIIEIGYAGSNNTQPYARRWSRGRQNSDYLTFYKKGDENNPSAIALGKKPMDFVYENETAFDQVIKDATTKLSVKQAIGPTNAGRWDLAADIVDPASNPTFLRTDLAKFLPDIVTGKYYLTMLGAALYLPKYPDTTVQQGSSKATAITYPSDPANPNINRNNKAPAGTTYKLAAGTPTWITIDPITGTLTFAPTSSTEPGDTTVLVEATFPGSTRPKIVQAKVTVTKETVNPGSNNSTLRPTKPDNKPQPQPSKPDNKLQPTSPEKQKPETVNPPKQVASKKPNQSAKETATHAKNYRATTKKLNNNYVDLIASGKLETHQLQKQLPQTGAKDTKQLRLVGAALTAAALTIIGCLGIDLKKKQQ